MWYEKLLEKGLIPEFLLRRGIRSKIQGRINSDPEDWKNSSYYQNLIDKLQSSPIAIHTQEANEQHYELSSDFFELILGPYLKYSCCYFEDEDTLGEAEIKMLDFTVQRAGVKDGDNILDLGCGWGSLSIYLAEQFPNSSITALSNSTTQKSYIDSRAVKLGIDNLTVYTGNIADFQFSNNKQFDKIISVEMFEHMRNYSKLMVKLSTWLKTDGILFVHIFTRFGTPYLFESQDDQNFMAKYFFTGGTMLNVDDLIDLGQNSFDLIKSWDISGLHYHKTLEIWLERMKAKKDLIHPILQQTYGSEFKKWWEYWKIFFIVCSELFKFNNGNEWIVRHYKFRRINSHQ